ncbi:hypothetical protein AAZX31_12G142400 [Glycine max]|uniref:Auxin response factor 11 n=2 Tax=Glycine soja TaxID=3848 RepID=A0A0B2PWZ6_GLYSO|nr:hypothetical protein JHK86_034025 [Glycine max]KAG5119528.1 hypothetical protein JHK82_033948 [Glycine max]KAG5140515.1 hypothetical protein JHK84_034283 [Glycine max]KAH1221737.1 Auxin response factor 11 [Glycine max]KHN12238.1 Auxin response factor 11 [Glycine soja]|eukprot:XP_014620312.1 auxin response factor 5 [Glycine max]
MMASMEEKIKIGGGMIVGAQTLAAEMKLLKEMQEHSGVRKTLNSELWHACARPLVSLPQVGSLVFYFPQGHSEQVEASTRRTTTSHIPNYPNLPYQLMCQVQNAILHVSVPSGIITLPLLYNHKLYILYSYCNANISMTNSLYSSFLIILRTWFHGKYYSILYYF